MLLVTAVAATCSGALAHPDAGARGYGYSGSGTASYTLGASIRAVGPANDDWGSAAVLPGESGSLTNGTNVGATTQDPAGEVLTLRAADTNVDTTSTVWWKWTAPSTGSFVFDTAGSDFDTVLGIFQGTALATLTPVTAADDSDENLASRVAFDASAGTTYSIQVGGSPGAEGTIHLAWKPNPVANDVFADRAVITGLTGTTTSTNLGATLDPDEKSSRSGHTLSSSVWYAWTPGEGNAEVTLHDASFAGWLAVYTGTTLANLQPVSGATGCTGLDVCFSATAATTYLVQVGVSDDFSGGTFSLDWSLAQAPGAPTLEVASGADHSVSLAWSAPASDGGSAIDHYRVYRGTAPGSETFLDQTATGDIKAYTDSTAVNGTTYYYEVSASNEVGEGAPSNERAATGGVPATAPTAPTLNSATPGNGSVTLAWSAPTSDGGSAVTGYRIYRSTTSGGEGATPINEVGAVTGYVDNTVSNGTTYFYEVTALNTMGESPRSNELSAKPAPPATVPGAPVLNQPAVGVDGVTLGWNTPVNGGSAITGYRIYRGLASGGETMLTAVGTSNTYTDATASNGTTYFYAVTAVNAVGEGAFSNEQPATTVPGAPTLTAAVPGNSTVALTWTAPASGGGAGAVTSFTIYRTPAGGPEALLTTIGDTSVTTYDDDTAVNGTTYTYRVAGVNAAGESAKSNGITVTPSTVPAPPTLTAATAGNGTVTVTWNAANANGSPVTGYELSRAVGAGSSTLLVTLGDVTTYTDSAVTNGTIYDYRLVAVNANGKSLGSNIGTAVPAPVSYGAPGWWTGACDSGWWNPRAAAHGWHGQGAQPLDGSYLGIPACGPRPDAESAPTVPWSRAGQAVPEWDSSEYAFRFMAQVYGVEPYAATAKDVVRNYTAAAGGGLQFVANGTPGSPPQAGDVISFDNPNGAGLVGVIGWAGVDASGNGEVRLIAENDAAGGWRRLSVVNWTVVGLSPNTAYGWLHDPLGRGAGSVTNTPGERSDPVNPTTVVPRPVTPEPPNTTRRPPEP
jgi:fibronectin type 3 domain-containing protein